MKLKKILNDIKAFFTKKDPDKKYIELMEKTLHKLREKAQKLEVQLKNEKNLALCKDINLTLMVIYKQQKKCIKLIDDRKNNSSLQKKHKVNTRTELSPPLL
ncbi:MAG: hypothetical protein OQL19_15690 [Gammaproteobacteria bacterium]|nr:hypothetical protein [Gammaproteobacteria bacterium]